MNDDSNENNLPQFSNDFIIYTEQNDEENAFEAFKPLVTVWNFLFEKIS